ncbi:ABC transporter permease subunit, partial [Ochrobactrum sp. SFR4]|uniref:ABC transporter permease subunit n=1 Tax=Ochrobactrum sp. SFR4 TaxID=2717368 RepID=UPI001C8BAE75
LTARLAPPSATHWFGTDEVGRDLFSRVIYGARASCGAAFMIVLISMSIGVLIGCLSGVLGGRIDTGIMRLMDVVMALPALVLAMALAAALGPSLFNSMLAVAVGRLPPYCCLAR